MNTKKLNIGFDAKRYFQNKTGLGNYSHHIIDGLALLFPNLTISLFTPQKDTSKHTVIAPQKSNLLAKIWRISGMVHEKSFKKLDVYHGLSNELPWRKTKVKTVVTVHDIIFKHLPETQHPINRWIYDFKTRHSCKIATKIVATSHYTKKDLVKFYGINRSKIEVIYQDCHPQFYLNPISDAVLDKYTLQKPYILCVGTIEKRKQQLELVQAFASIQFGGELILVGKKTKYYSKIAQYLTENPQLEQRVRVIENADFQDFPSIYAHAHLFVYPSVCEGFGIPILEAMNTKTAVLTTKKTVMEEVGDDAVAYYTKYSVASLTETMQELVDDSNYRNKLINKGLERALLFRKEINLDQLHQLYHTL